MLGGRIALGDLAINLLCAFIAIDYINRGFLKKYSGWQKNAASACGIMSYFFLVLIFNLLTPFEGVLGLCYGVVLYLYGRAALLGRRLEMAVVSSVWVLIAYLGYYITSVMIRLLLGGGPEVLPEQGLPLSYCVSLFACLLRLGMARLVLKFKKSISRVARAEELTLTSAFLAIFVVAAGIGVLDLGSVSWEHRNLLALVQLFGILGLTASLGYLSHRLNLKNREKWEAEFDRRQIAQQRRQLEEISCLCVDLGGFRHDLAGMLGTVSAMLNRGKIEEAMLCLSRMDRRLKDSSVPQRSTGNEGLDAALYRTDHICKEQEIDFHYAVGGDVGAFDHLDMGILFQNLLDNAVEACCCLEKKGEGEISLHIWGKPDGILCRLENTVRESVFKTNPQLLSQKPEKMRHGFGLKSILAIVKQYNGSYSASEEDGMFIQEIRLRAKQTCVHVENVQFVQ